MFYGPQSRSAPTRLTRKVLMFMRIPRSVLHSRRTSLQVVRTCRALRRRTVAASFALLAGVAAVACPPTASAGSTIINGSECVPFVSASVVPLPTTPLVFPYGNRLDIHRNGSDWNFIINCSFPLHSGDALATGEVTLAIVDGRSLNSVRLCFGRYYTDAFSCGPADSGPGPAYFLSPPSPKPSGSTVPFIFVSTTVTAANTPVKVRSITGFWSVP